MNSTLFKFATLAIALTSLNAHADLVIKTGQVIGRDGQIYDGMSPETREALEAQAESGILKSGVVNGNFYMILDGVVSTVPLRAMSNLGSEERLELVKTTFAQDARETLEQEYRNRLMAAQSESIEDEIKSEVEEHQGQMEYEVERHLNEVNDDIEREIDDHVDEIKHEIEREIEDHIDEIEHEMERELEDHMNEIEHEIEREVESHMEEIEHEIENHSRELEREVEHHSEDHDDDHHDDHDDDD
jgi:hypothetical protein